MPKRKYSGLLAEPIVVDLWHPQRLGDTPEALAKVHRHNEEQESQRGKLLIEKLDLLLAEFKIKQIGHPAITYLLLALALAIEYVPGFATIDKKQKKTKGAPVVWDVLKYLDLFHDVTGIMIKRDCSRSEACNILKTTAPYKSSWGNYSKGTLENRYIDALNEAKNPLAGVLKPTVENLFPEPRRRSSSNTASQ